MSTDSTPQRARRWFVVPAVVVAVTAGLVVGGLLVTRSDNTPTRQEVIAERGATVMPFDLDATQHEFETTATGAVETVTANRRGDTTQVALIRGHLRSEATRFRNGDFGDPAEIHGHDMPGLRTLAQSAERITVTYAERPSGATITFTTSDASVRSALADWVAAQNMDHGTAGSHG